MNLQEGQTSWEGILNKCISDLREKYPRLTDGQIADRIDVKRSTFNRIKNEGKFPRLDNLIKVVIGSGNTNILADVVSLLDETIGNSLKDALSIAMKEENKILAHDDLEEILEDRDLFIAYLLADMPNGTDKMQLTEVLGSTGIHAINTLVKKEIVEERGNFHVKNKGVLVRSFDSIKHHLSTYARFYKPEHVGKERNYAHSLTDGLSIQGLKKVQDAHRRFHEEIQSIYRDQANRGDIPSFSVAFCDTFTSINSNDVKKEELQ